MFSKRRINILFAFIFVFLFLFFACTDEPEGESTPVPVQEDLTGDQEVQYTVMFDSVGGSMVPSQKYTYDSLISKPSDPTRENYTFDNWYVDSLYSKKWDFENDTVLSSMTLYAKWKMNADLVVNESKLSFSKNKKEIFYTLSYNKDALNLTDDFIVSENNVYLIYAVTDLNKEKPLFSSNTADFENLSFGNNKFSLVVKTADLSQEVATYSLTIYRNSLFTIRFFGQEEEYLGDAEVEENSAIVFPDYKPRGHIVSSWNLPDNSPVQNDSQNRILATSDNMYFYASCSPEKYTVRLNSNGGEVTYETKVIAYGSNYDLPIPTKEGNVFNGWTTVDGVELTGNNGESYNSWNYVDINDLYARWTPYKYTFTNTTEIIIPDEHETIGYVYKNSASDSQKYEYNDKIKVSVTKAPDGKCSSSHTAFIYNEKTYVQFCDCDVFGTVLEASGNTTQLSKHTDQVLTENIFNKIDSIGELYTSFLSNCNEDNYFLLNNKIFDLFNESYNPVSKGIFNNKYAGALIDPVNSSDFELREYYIEVVSPKESEKRSYYEKNDDGSYTLTSDTRIIGSKTYYKKFLHSDYIDVISRLFGYDTSETFKRYCQAIATELKNNTLRASSDNRLAYDGSVYTDNNCFIFPYVLKNDRGNTILCCLLSDNSGRIRLWINDIPTAITITEIDKAQHDDTHIEVIGRCMLFNTNRVDDLTALGISPDDFVYYVFCGWYDEKGNILSKTFDYSIDGIKSDTSIKNVWTTITVRNYNKKEEKLLNNCSVFVSPDDKDLSEGEIARIANFGKLGETIILYSRHNTNEMTFVEWTNATITSQNISYRLRPTQSGSIITCNWTGFDFSISSDTETDWKIYLNYIEIDKNSVNTISAVTVDNSLRLQFDIVLSFPEETTRTFCGWYYDEGCTEKITFSENTMKYLGNRQTKFTFDLPANDSAVYLKWIDIPIYLNKSDYIDKAKVQLDLRSNICGDYFCVDVQPIKGYFYSGIYTDDSFTETLQSYTLQEEITGVFIDVKENCPFTILTNIPGAGKIDYTITKKDRSVSSGVCSDFGKRASFDNVGVSFDDILTLSSTTFNNYVWMGWYYYNYNNKNWVLMDTSKVMEIKDLSSSVVIRATWKSIETDIDISINNPLAGSVSYYTIIDSSGAQILQLNTTINYGYVFEGWYAEGISYYNGSQRIDDPLVLYTDSEDIYIRNNSEKVLLSRSVQYSADLSDISGKYDLTTIEAVFSEVSPTIICFYEGQTYYKDELHNSGEAGIIGYYLEDSKDSLHYEIIVELKQNKLSDYPDIGSFVSIKTSGQGESDSITPDNTSGLINTSGSGNYSPKYNSDKNTFSYLFKVNEINSSETLTLNYVSSQATKTGFPNSIIDESNGNSGEITLSCYQSMLYLKVKPNNGNIFGGWIIVDKGTPKGTTAPTEFNNFISISGANDKDYYAVWEDINNDANFDLFARVSDENAASIRFYGEKISSGTENKIGLYTDIENGYSFKGWYDEDNNLVSAQKDFTITYSNISSFLGNKNVIYTAVVTPISSKIVFDTATEYIVTGFANEDGTVYYNVIPADNIDDETNEIYNRHYFLGWYENITDETPLYTSLKLTNISENELPHTLYAKWSNDSIKKIILMNMDESNRGGKAHYTYIRSETDGTLRIKMSVDIDNGYRFIGWQSELDVNSTILSTQLDFSVAIDEELKDIYYYSFERLANDDSAKNIQLITNPSSEITASIDTVADPIIYSYNAGAKYYCVLDSGVKNGYLFSGWNFSGTDKEKIENDSSVSFFDPFIELSSTSTFTSFTATANYALMQISALNTSISAGEIRYYGYYENVNKNKINFVIECTPNDKYALWKIVSSDGQTYYYNNGSNEDVRWSVDNGTVKAIFKNDTDDDKTYTVYWRSIWQTLPHYSAINECVNHVAINASTYVEKRSYSTGLENYVQVYELNAAFDADEYTFIGWYRDEIHDRSAAEITYDQYYCDKSSNKSTFITDYPTETKRYFTKWGKYVVTLATNDESKFLSPEGYTATISYIMEKTTNGSQTYISDIGVAYMNEYNENVLQQITDSGYEYLPLDLNKGEGGKIVLLVWKSLPINTPAATFITKLSFNDLQAFTAKVLFADEENIDYKNNNLDADLNFGTVGTPIKLYYSKDTTLGTPLEKIGLYYNNKNNGFGGECLLVDSDESKDLTPLSGLGTMFMTYKRGETAMKIALTNVTDDPNVILIQTPENNSVAITNQMTYPDYYVNIEYTPRGLIFAGWYDTPTYEGKPYDFSSTVYGDVTLYPKWYLLSDYDINIDNVLSLNIPKKYTNNRGVYYFTSLSDTLYTVSFSFDTLDPTYLVTITDLIDSKTILTSQMSGKAQYSLSFAVTAGRLYKLNLQSAGINSSMEIGLSGELPIAGGSFCNIIPFNEDVVINAKPKAGQTFVGWFNESNEEVGEKTVYSYQDDKDNIIVMYTIHNQNIIINKESIKANVYRRAMYETYTIEFGYRQTEASQRPTYSVADNNIGLVVGEIVTLSVNEYNGFKFKEWLLYNNQTGETYSFTDDERFVGMNDKDASKNKTFSFKMIEESLIIIPTWSIDDTSTRYNIDAFNEYTIEYRNAYINSPDNRINFYHKIASGSTPNVDEFYLNEPSRYEVIDGEMYVYSFEGWFYENRNGEQITYVPLETVGDRPYCFKTSTAINYLVNGKVYIYAQWGQCIPTLQLYHDDVDNVDYIYLGEYPQSMVVAGEDEFNDITKETNENGYYYNWQKTIKYYKYSDSVYFRVDKIRWDVLYDKNGQMLVYSHSLLFNYFYNISGNTIKDIYANNWENSSIRNYLNNQFFNNAFNIYEQNLIELVKTRVDNSIKQGNSSFEDNSRYPWSIQNDTDDYLYLLSYKELQEGKYGFEQNTDIPCHKRKVECSDYFMKIMEDNNITDYYYWTRSVGNEKMNVYVVDKDGKLVLKDNVTNPWYGARIAITLSSEQIYR